MVSDDTCASLLPSHAYVVFLSWLGQQFGSFGPNTGRVSMRLPPSTLTATPPLEVVPFSSGSALTPFPSGVSTTYATFPIVPPDEIGTTASSMLSFVRSA